MSLKVAKALQAELSEDFECTVWDQDHFRLGESTMAGLCRAANTFDFAAVVVTPDDQLSTGAFTPRDNIVFEAGLFVGALGPERVALIMRSDIQVKAPSDWNGITYAPYKAARPDENLRAAIGPAATRIREMGSMGPRAVQHDAARLPDSTVMLPVPVERKTDPSTDAPPLKDGRVVSKESILPMKFDAEPGAAPESGWALRVWRNKQEAAGLTAFEHAQLAPTLQSPELVEQCVEGAFSKAESPELIESVNQRLQISELVKQRKSDNRPPWPHFELARTTAMKRPEEFTSVATTIVKQRRPRRFGEPAQAVAPAELLEMAYDILSSR